MEGLTTGGKHPAPTFSTENEPFYDLLTPGNSTNHQPGSSTAAKPVDFGENILPNYDFHPTRPAAPMNNSGNKIMSPTLSEQSLDGKASINEPSRPKPSEADENKDMVAAVERTMKKYADNLMRVLEDMQSKLSQLERTTDRLESSVAELQNRSGDQHGELDGRVRGLEHVLREVQRGVQLLRDKSELAEAQAELSKMQVTAKPAPPTPALVAPPQTFPALTAPPLAPEEAANQPVQAQPQSLVERPALTPVPIPSAPSAPPHQLSAPAPQYQPPPQAQSQPQPQAPPPPQGPPQQPPNYSQPPPYMQQQPPASAPPPPPAPQQPQQPQVQSGPSLPPPQYGPQAPPYMQRPPPQQQQEVPAYLPQGYGQQAGVPPHQMPPPPAPPSQQGPPRQGYEGPPPQGAQHPGGRLALPAPPGSYGPPPPQGYTDRPVSAGGYDRPPPASYDRPPTSGYERPAPAPYDRPQQSGYDRPSGYEPRVPTSPYAPPPFASGGGAPAPGTYPRLQMAQPVQSSEPPRAGGSGGPPQLSTSKMPIEQVIDDVAAMGFHKDEVRSIVRQLTETGKSVDLNIVLDTLMNRSGGSAPPSRGGW